jgi:CubicO group peptidase (beta-lactamase class C family)
VARLGLAGLAVAVVRGVEMVMRGFRVRDVRTGVPVTPETMFHLASVSKPFVSTTVMALAACGDLDLDAPPTQHVPEISLADGRAAEVTARGLLSHTSGLGDVTDYFWHGPRLGDEALSDFARSLSDRRLKSDPGADQRLLQRRL